MIQLRQGGRLRTKTGCGTCRIRRVKCDETRPGCIRCEKTGRTCDGYNRPIKLSSRNRSPGKVAIATPLPALPSFDDSRQREFFAFFVTCTSKSTAVYFGSNFWAHRVLQLSLSEPAIRYALCSLSALFRLSTYPDPSSLGFTIEDLRNYALLQYNHAIRYTHALLEETSQSDDKLLKGLVACALFVSYENFTGNHQVAQMHLENGYRIIARECRLPRSTKVPRDIIQTFKRLDLMATSLTNSRLPNTGHLVNEPLELLPSPSSTPSFTIEDSIDVVLDLCRWLFRKAAIAEACPLSPSDLKAANDALAEWNVKILTSLNKNTHNTLQQPTVLLQIYQIIMTIIIATGVLGQETLHDAHLLQYQEIITLAAGITSSQFFCFDIGIIFPLFWVAVKCRDSRTRRRAVTMLGSLHHQECAWTSAAAAKAAEFVVNLEEEGLEENPQQHQILELKRVHLVHTIADEERGEICLSCLMRRSLDGSSWYTREGRIVYKGELRPGLVDSLPHRPRDDTDASSLARL